MSFIINMASREEYQTLLATLQNLQEVVTSQIHSNDDGMAAHISNVFDLSFDSVIEAMESHRNSSGPMRMCPPNKTKITQKTTQQSPKDLSKGDKVTIVLNYGPRGKSHALFGDFKVKYSKYRDEFLNPTSWIRFSRLAIGPGWMLLERDRLSELKKSLKKFNIQWHEIEFKDFNKNEEKKSSSEEEEPEPKKSKKKSKKKVESSDSEEEPNPKKSKKKSKRKVESSDEELEPVDSDISVKKSKKKVESSDSEEEPPKETKKSKKSKKKVESSDSEEEVPEEPKPKKSGKVKSADRDKLSANQYGNLQEKKFGIIFAKLPVGKKNRIVNVAIGNQDTDTPPSKKYKGLKTVKCLTDVQIEECEDRAWTVLSEDMVDNLEGNEEYEDLAAELRAILQTSDVSDVSETSESEGSGSGSGSGSESESDSDSD